MLRLTACFLLLSQTVTAQTRDVSFNRDISPLLSDRCVFCHGPDDKQREADLRLDLKSVLTAKASEGRVIVPGQPDRSVLMERITSEDPDFRMPPLDSGKKLSKHEIQLFRDWIKSGAKWEEHWAWQKPRKHEVPKVGDENWSWTWIDKFISERLDQERISPSDDADAVTLCRRLYFDLIGLPPAAADVDAFISAVKNDRRKAIAELTTKLLESDHLGERMAVYWLDLVRYADTVGYHGDQDHSITPYRDYVIDAFNDNIRFDQFTREQLAGDLLPNSTVDQKIASGYNRLLQTSHEGGVQIKEYLAMYMADRVRNLSGVWMGATMGCAECHNHKYDPFTAKDFYSIGAFFADLDEAQHFKVGGNSLPTKRPPELTVHTKRERARLAELDAVIARVKDAIAKSERPEDQALHKGKLIALEKEKAELLKAKRPTMVSVSIKPRTIRILPRGSFLNETGPVVEPAVPEFMGRVDADGKDGKRATRLDLANWLTNLETGAGGLTSRVFVNRVWYLLFDSGLTQSLDDFGLQGDPPEHPELLDNLAISFIESGWDVKKLVRDVVTSRVYQQSSTASEELRTTDPKNRLYARQSQPRLHAEFVRDYALAVGGILNREIGGGAVKPYQPAGYYRHLNFPTRKYAAHRDTRQWRRGVYVHWQRQFLHPMLQAFDAPRREECVARRATSNTPASALVMLNDPTIVEASRAFGQRILIEGGKSFDERLRFAFRAALSRGPDAEEQTVSKEFIAATLAEYEKSPKDAAELCGVGLSDVPPGVDIKELAAWTNLGRVILNLSEAITRN
ncbi:MAG: PSD1 and planctomycete cytochrome C domain-containing protein [Planctomycetota bacterium]|nr:PSD1 and planctomycete cytochrome C domain-containing protein [Planctomycetota bacterium]